MTPAARVQAAIEILDRALATVSAYHKINVSPGYNNSCGYMASTQCKFGQSKQGYAQTHGRNLLITLGLPSYPTRHNR